MTSSAVQRALDALEACDCNPRGNVDRGWDARCPAHEDRSPSLKLDQGRDGRALVYCHRGCSLGEITASLKLTASDLFRPDDDRNGNSRRIVETYPYVDEARTLLYEVVRYDPKDFRQRRPDGNGGWIWKLDDTRRVLYHLPEIVAAIKADEWIFLPEGERDVHALEQLGKVATTNPGGAGKWRPEYTETLRGAKVAIVQDVDQPDEKGKCPGQDHARQVFEALDGVAAKVKLLEPAEGKDVSEHLAADLKLNQLRPVDESGGKPPEPEPVDGTGPVEDVFHFEVMTARDLCRLPDPPSEQIAGPLLVRGDRTVIGAGTGEGKTSFALAMIRAIVHGQEFLGYPTGRCRILILDAEQGLKTIKRRLVEAGLDDSAEVDVIRAPDGLSLDRDEQQVAAIERVIASGGHGAVILDPLYKLHIADSNEERGAVDLMRTLDRLREALRFALMLPMHTRKAPASGAKFTMNEFFGSSAYTRGAEIVLGLHRPKDGYAFLHIFKHRDGDLSTPDKWPLLFSRETGYRHDPNATEPKSTCADKIREALADGIRMTAEQLAKETGYAAETIRKTAAKMDDVLGSPGPHGHLIYVLQEPLPGFE
jgi:hypothetical protein